MTVRRGLRHAAFFEALATQDPAGAAWRATSAGLVTLRLVDRWIQLRSDHRSPSVEAVRAVRRAVGRVDRGHPLRPSIDALSCAVSGALHSAGLSATRGLLDYARALHASAQWALAIDVYLTFIEHAEGPDEVEARAQASSRIEACRRMLERRGTLLADIGVANIALERGNLPAAEKILEETCAAAQSAGMQDVMARATHDLGYVCYHRATAHPDGRVNTAYLDRAAQHFFSAFKQYPDPVRRDRALVDLATTLAARGLIAAARDGFYALYHSTADPDVRWSAALNLLDVASREGDDAAFRHYADALEAAPLAPAQLARMYLVVGDGARRFGRVEHAHWAYQQAIIVAEANGINEVLVLAEAALGALAREDPLPHTDSAEAPRELAPVIRALASL
jgi:tetratricopeptide (TPR) repeat protein